MSLVIFRLDSSKILGSGHVQRCVTLANYLREIKTESVFICKNLEGNFAYIIENNNYKVYYIGPSLDEVQDSYATIEILKSYKNIKSIIIDNYSLGISFEQNIKNFVSKIVVIDDLMNRVHACDILLDQNYRQDYLEAYDLLVPHNCKKYLGPAYALLRPQFYTRQQYASDIKKSLQNIFVFFGGSDPTGEMLKFLQSVKNGPNFKYHVLLSKGHSHLSEILNLKDLSKFSFYIEPENIASIMEKCDFYVGSGGTITWERMCMKLSGIVVTVAENQIPGAQGLANDHLHIYYGTKEKVDYTKIPLLIKSLEVQSLKKINSQIQIYKNIFSFEKLSEFIKEVT